MVLPKSTVQKLPLGEAGSPHRASLMRMRYSVKHCGNNGRIRRNVPTLSFRPQRSGVEESTTLDNEPPQDKICNSGRFLDSLSLPRNDMSGGGSVVSAQVIVATLPERHTGRSLRFRWEVVPLRPLFLQCRTPYRASSTAYGGLPSPKGKVMGVVPFNRTGCIRSVAWR